jgi:hypothetical protein
MRILLIVILLILHILKIYGDCIEIDVNPNSNESLEPYDMKYIPINLLLGNKNWRYIKNKVI